MLICEPARIVLAGWCMSNERLIALVDELRTEGVEKPWCEFKHNNDDERTIIKLVSALSNGARLHEKTHGYIVWGVQDGSLNIVGTQFDPFKKRVGNQGFEFWLGQHLTPSPNFQFSHVPHELGDLILLQIDAAISAPVRADGVAYIRIGDATPPLHDYPDREGALWERLRPLIWERGVALSYQTADDVLDKVDYASYFELTKQRLPDNREGITRKLIEDRIIEQDVGGRWNVLNLGACLFARKSDGFEGLARKAIRVIEYEGTGRVHTQREQLGTRGYASGFDGLMTYINARLPRNEHIGQAFRAEEPMYPDIAIRELIANALIHQDFSVRGSGPMVEIFFDRIEITNPGRPLVSPDRFIDTPPRSRNEAVASLMRRMNICEERGSGIDKVINAVELFQMPPPDIRIEGDNTKIVLFAPRSYVDMTPVERVRATYQHAVLKWLNNDKATNASLRQRFGLPDTPGATSQVSRVLSEAREAQIIKLADPAAPKSGYVPGWA